LTKVALAEHHPPMSADSATSRLVGPQGATVPEEANGYVFWGLLALFIGIPELLAGIKWTRERVHIPWPTISNLVGKDLETHHHWIALIVVGLIAYVVAHALSYPAASKTLGRAAPGADVSDPLWGRVYIGLTALAGAAAGGIAAAFEADKNQLGYSMYLTLSFFGIVVPTLFRRFSRKVLAIPTLFASLALLRARTYFHWVAAFIVAALLVLTFHLALYPWPNYHFGVP
jgi:hypothetical protein